MKQEVKSVLLPIENHNNYWCKGELTLFDGKLSVTTHTSSPEEKNPMKYVGRKPQHLYIVDESAPIKEGELCIKDYGMAQELLRYKSEYGNTCRKIIATTNPEIHKEGVPSISEETLKQYVDCQGKCKVMVEMENWNTISDSDITKRHLLKNKWVYVKSQLPEFPFNDAEIHYYQRIKLDSSGNAVISIEPEEPVHAAWSQEMDEVVNPDKYKAAVKHAREYFTDGRAEEFIALLKKPVEVSIQIIMMDLKKVLTGRKNSLLIML